MVRRGLIGISALIIALSVPVILTIGSIRLLMTTTYLRLEYYKPDFPPDPYGLTLYDRLQYAPYAVHYLTNNAPISYLADLSIPNAPGSSLAPLPIFNARELAHMVDVQRVTQTAFLVGIGFTLALLVIGLSALRTFDGRRRLRLSLMWGATFTLGLIGILAFGVLFAWDTFFTSFHELFFASGTWTFEYSDSLIRLFPVQFWQDAAITIGGAVAIGAGLILIGGWLWGRRSITHPVLADPAGDVKPIEQVIRQW